MAQLEIEIRSSIVHTLTVKQFEDWLKAGARSPKENGYQGEGAGVTVNQGFSD